jgi:hypothetical protein
MADGLIELGERVDPQVRSGRRPRSRPRTVAGLVAVAVLIAVAGSGGPPPRLSGPVWTIAGVDTFRPGQDTVYVITGGTVEARAAGTGQVRWRRPTGGRAQDAVELGHGLVAITVAPPAPSNVDSGVTTIVARITTGETLATAPGFAVARSDERLLVGCDFSPACGTLSAIGLVDVGTQWTIPVTSIRAISFDHAAGVFALQTDDELQLRASATGTLLRSEPMPATADTNGTGSGSQPVDRANRPAGYGVVVAGHLVTVRRTGSQTTVDAQPVTGAAAGWSLTLPATPGRPSTGPIFAQACGQLLCVFVDLETTVIDPGTGRVRGHIAGAVISDSFSDVLGPYVVFQTLEGTNTTGLQVLRARDLSVVASLPQATPMSWRSNDGRVMFSRFTAAGISLTVLDRRGYQRTIGTVPGADVHCLAYALILTCIDQRTLTTRRIPSAEQLAAGVGNGRP